MIIRLLLVLSLLASLVTPVCARPPFTELDAGITAVGYAASAWGDYDSDGDLDIVVAGSGQNTIYKNTGGVFTALTGVYLDGLYSGVVVWGDYDNDGDLDLAIAGDSYSSPVLKVFKNYGNDSFSAINLPVNGVRDAGLVWGDFDNDGDLDLVYSGNTGSSNQSMFCRNDGGDTFTPLQTKLLPVSLCELAAADVDNDGDLDIVLTGTYNDSPITRLYKNDGDGNFTAYKSDLPNITNASLSWGDFDCDGDPDLALCGWDGKAGLAAIYENVGGAFQSVKVDIPQVSYGDVAWGDVNNDGLLDLIVSGSIGTSCITRVLLNRGGEFEALDPGIPDADSSSAVWGDFDNDGDLDLYFSGHVAGQPFGRIYRNECVSPNSAPQPPGTSTSTVQINNVILGWGAGNDGETPPAGLSYNLRVGTSPGSGDILSAMADASTGYRRVVSMGNVGQNREWKLNNLAAGTYYWSVQSIDNCCAGSQWMAERTFVIPPIKISGYIRTPQGTAVQGVNVRCTKGGASTTTDWQGYYEIIVPQGWTGTVKVSKPGYWFSPLDREYAGIMSDISGQDFIGNQHTFTDTGVIIQSSRPELVDFDNDGDLDLSTSTGLYRNDGDEGFVHLSDISYHGRPAWGDFDNDGDLDAALPSEYDEYGGRILVNNGDGTFTETPGIIWAIYETSAWGDYDNDGWLDLVTAGQSGNNGKTRLYHNNGDGTFSEVDTDLKDVMYASLVWVDYDSDGDLDLHLSGSYSLGYQGYSTSLMYDNDGNGNFTQAAVNLPYIQGSAAWGDYDNDGDMDLAITGYVIDPYSQNQKSYIYRNDGDGVFTDIKASLPQQSTNVKWVDFDNDGDLDLAFGGLTGGVSCRIYINEQGVFGGSNIVFNDSNSQMMDWGDLDNDGDMDLVLDYHSSQPGIKVYRNNGGVFNSVPTPPTQLSSQISATGITFNWNMGSDSATPAEGLYYNLRVGTTPGADNVFSGMADLNNGYLRKPSMGNAQKRLSWTLKNVPSGTLYWSVQSIDSMLAGSSWAAERTVITRKIRGRVKTSKDENVSGVTLSASGLGQVTTGANGEYTLIVPNRWNGTVTVSKPGFTFTPSQRTYANLTIDQTGQDFTVASGFTVSNMVSGYGVLYNGTLAWGDYNNDGRQDFIITGSRDYSLPYPQTLLYTNYSTSFYDDPYFMPFLDHAFGSAAWGDFDNDGRLDLAISGFNNDYVPVTRIYRNSEEYYGFIDIGASLPGLYYSSLAWGDYDNDGDLDLAAAGILGSSGVVKIFRNDGGSFVDANIAGFVGVYSCSLAWADYDNDGDVDLAVTGETGSSFLSSIYRNDGSGTFTDINAGLIGVARGSLTWEDYDMDGDMDLAITGTGQSGPVTALYRNDGLSGFVKVTTTLPATYDGSLAWGDFDNDGDPDLAIGGYTSTGAVCKIYRNDGGEFIDSGLDLAPILDGALGWSDYDNDGDLDLAALTSGGTFLKLYVNQSVTLNTPPAAPTGVAADFISGILSISWNPASDDQTTASGLTYNVRVGTTPGSGNVFSPMADSSTGWRLLPAHGNAEKRLSWTLKNLPTATYYVSVQAIDASFAGSAWSDEIIVSLPRISGYVKGEDGSPISGVSVSADNGGSTCTTDADGYYEVWVPKGWDGTVSVSRTAYWFNPSYRIYSDVTSNIDGHDYTGGTFSFTDTGAGLSGACYSSLAWADFDNDGDYDLALTGWGSTGPISKLYSNTGAGAFDSAVTLPVKLSHSSAAWGDYDNDGDLDIAISGWSSIDEAPVSIIFRNDNGTFVDSGAVLEGVYYGSLAWADFDNDCDLDLAISGWNGLSSITKIYRNNGNGSFTDSNIDLEDVYLSSLAWADYDNDGDLDLALAGYNGTARVSKLYRNTDGILADSGTVLADVSNCSIAWGDYDSDGDFDLLLAGNSAGGPVTKLYQNIGGTLVDSGVEITGATDCSLAWGDYDLDGDLDLAIAGRSQNGPISRIYRNDGGSFVDAGIELPGVELCSLAWADCDGDTDPDLAISGWTGTAWISRIYHNNGKGVNDRPTAPTANPATFEGDTITFTWSPSTDVQTPSAGLTYNLRVGTQPGSDDVFRGAADLASGFRRLPAPGFAGSSLTWTLKGLPQRTYYFSVQAVDSGFAGSPWSQEIIVTPTYSGSEPKTLPDGAGIMLDGWYVTAQFNGYFYMEREDRSCGIKIQSSTSHAIGTKIHVNGIMRTDSNDERYIESLDENELEGTLTIKPVGMTSINLGGGALAYDLDNGSGQRGITGASGLNNIGLLVRVCGSTTSFGSQCFTITDGGAEVKVAVPAGVAIDPGWTYVFVTGISSCEKVDNNLIRVLRVRDQADIQAVQ